MSLCTKRHAVSSSYTPKIPLWAYFSKKHRAAYHEAARERFAEDFAYWQSLHENAASEHETQLAEWEKEKERLLSEWAQSYQNELLEWESQKQAFTSAQETHNASLTQLKQQYEACEQAAVEKYCMMVLANSQYPFQFALNSHVEYLTEARTIALDYSLPTIEVVPSLKEAKYVKSKREIKRTFITDKQRHDAYEKLLYGMVFRSIHELFEADTVSTVDNVIFNGWVESLDKATGHLMNRCILSLSVTKTEFEALNLANIDVRECFKKLKGVGSSKLSELVPIAPILELQKNDRRFVQSYDVSQTIEEGDNLAIMPWEDFEHLVRELFEKEFGANGGEVRVTQASRDGGVDAVIFDPDPIRGGKIIVQAKRYSNTVGVAAVRDLYGTLINEGAMKGILITTSDYGPDAFNFAKDKPITLMSGANLLHLLERHGKKAKIDLKEAKQKVASS